MPPISTTLASDDVVNGVNEDSFVDDARKESLSFDMAKKKRNKSKLKHVSARKQDTADNPCKGNYLWFKGIKDLRSLKLSERDTLACANSLFYPLTSRVKLSSLEGSSQRHTSKLLVARRLWRMNLPRRTCTRIHILRKKV